MSQVPPSVTPNYQGPMPGQNKPAGMAVAAMVLGIVSLALFCFWFISIPCAIVAVILGALARGKAKRGEAGGAGMAMAGLVCGVVAIAIAILWISFIAALFGYGKKVGDEWQRELQRELDRQRQQNRTGTSWILPHISAVTNIIRAFIGL